MIGTTLVVILLIIRFKQIPNSWHNIIFFINLESLLILRLIINFHSR